MKMFDFQSVIWEMDVGPSTISQAKFRLDSTDLQKLLLESHIQRLLTYGHLLV